MYMACGIKNDSNVYEKNQILDGSGIEKIVRIQQSAYRQLYHSHVTIISSKNRLATDERR